MCLHLSPMYCTCPRELFRTVAQTAWFELEMALSSAYCILRAMRSTQRINKMEIWHLKVSESKLKEKLFLLIYGTLKILRCIVQQLLYSCIIIRPTILLGSVFQMTDLVANIRNRQWNRNRYFEKRTLENVSLCPGYRTNINLHLNWVIFD